MSKIKTELVTFAKAELTASIASVVDFGLAFILSDVICIYYGLANAIGVRTKQLHPEMRRDQLLPQLSLRLRRLPSQEAQRGLEVFCDLGHQLVPQFGRHHRPHRNHQP